MRKLGRALKAAVLLIAALPLAAVGNHAVGLAPAQVVLGAANPSGPTTVAAVASPARPSGVLAAPRRSRPTRQLQRAIADLQANTDEERADDLRDELDEEIEDLEEDLDNLEADLDDADADLDVLRDSNAKSVAEARLRTLEARLSNLQRQVRAIRSSQSLAAVQSLGVAITALRNDIRRLDVLIDLAEQRGGEEDDDEQQNNRDERNRDNDDDQNSDDD